MTDASHPSQRRRRSLSDQLDTLPALNDPSIHSTTPNDMTRAERVVRSVSLCTMRTFEREHHVSRLHITYQDDSLCQQSMANMTRLIRAAKTKEGCRGEANCHSNSVQIAKKALRYRRLLQRAEEANVDDPNFDVNAFLRVTWCKVSSSKSA